MLAPPDNEPPLWKRLAWMAGIWLASVTALGVAAQRNRALAAIGDAVDLALFLDDVTAANGPLLFIPQSHTAGVYQAGHDLETTSYPLWTLDRATVTRLAEEGGCVAPTGKAGSMLMFHGNLVHASPPNISPFPRTIVYLSLCEVSNHITKFTRKEWIAHRNFDPIESLPDDCLTELAAGQAAAE